MNQEHSIEQFRNVKIRLLLCSIPKNFKIRRSLTELGQKVEDDTMGRPRADHVREAKDPAALQETLDSSANERFGCELHRSIIRNWKQRTRIFVKTLIVNTINGRADWKSTRL